MTKFAYERVAAGLPMPGVFEVSLDMPMGQAIDGWEGQVRYLPL
jgi:hypothetical protein